MERKTEAYERRKRQLLRCGIIAFAILGIIIIILAIKSAIYSATVSVLVAPSDAKVLINDREYKNGNHSLTPGKYSVSINREGFESKNIDFEIKSGENYKLYACLNGIDDYQDWYEENQKENDICFEVNQYLVNKEEERMLSDPIFEIAPYHNYENGYYIDPYFSEDEEIIIKITALSCKPERREDLVKNALEFLEDSGIELENYKIEKANGCE